MTNSESSRLIAETLRLDGEAKATRQVALMVTSDAVKSAYMAERQARWNCNDAYLYSAPRLARMLQVAMDAVVVAEKHLGQLRVGDKMTNALAEIEKIARGE